MYPNARALARARILKQAFDITPSEWDKVFVFQEGVCFVCGRPSIGKRLALDHSHDSGIARALLCHACNALLGKIENNFKRFGLHKVQGLTIERALLRIISLLANPPVTQALGRQVFGYPGKIGSYAYRCWVAAKEGKAKPKRRRKKS